MNHSKLPLEYLLTSSQAGLEGFELGRLDKIAHLRKQLRGLVDQWVEAEIEAELARWLLECQRAQEAATGSQSREISFPLPGAAIAAAFLPLAGTGLAAAPPSHASSASRKRFAAKSAGVGSALAPRNAQLHPRQQVRPRTCQRQRLRSPASEEAQGSLNFLEQHMLSETEALGPPTSRATLVVKRPRSQRASGIVRVPRWQPVQPLARCGTPSRATASARAPSQSPPPAMM